MRIRKRLPPHVQIAADPSPRSPPSNGRKEEEERGRGGLHPDGDRPVDPNGRWGWRDPTLTRVVQDPPPSNPYPTNPIPFPPSHLNGCCIHPPPHAGRLQALKEDEKVHEVDLHNPSNAHININMRNGSNIGGAQVSGGPVIETAFPPKKMREGFEIEEEIKPVGKAAKGRAKVIISCDDEVEKGSGDQTEENEWKKRLMEGSRCSRVNGRGWRCCQQTLVGYSLCEHHLGKGRLRSVSSLRGQASGSKHPNKGGGSAEKQQQCSRVGNGEEEEEEKPARKRVKKIGMVKARSMTSLLNESNH